MQYSGSYANGFVVLGGTRNRGRDQDLNFFWIVWSKRRLLNADGNGNAKLMPSR
jgi:hypothetical protein